jgi:NDP-sugar pyrophosphorylase family protein
MLRLREGFAEAVVKHLPGGRIGSRLKLAALRGAGADVHWPISIDANVWIRQPHNFSAAAGAVISRGAVLNCSRSLRLGPGCLIGYYAFLGTASHRVPAADGEIRASGHDHAPVVLGSDCWVGAHACILPGVHLGDGAVVGAGTVVTKDVEGGDIVVGPGSRLIRSRNADAV